MNAYGESSCRGFPKKGNFRQKIRCEIEQGKIYGFWQTNFEDNRRHINADDDDALGKKIIYYFTMYNNRPVDIKEIAGKLNVPPKTVEKKIEKLYQADLVFRTKARYYTFNDICLMRFIEFVYGQDRCIWQGNRWKTRMDPRVQVHQNQDGSFAG